MNAPASGHSVDRDFGGSRRFLGRDQLVLDGLVDRNHRLFPGADRGCVERQFRVGRDKGVELRVHDLRRVADQRIAAVLKGGVDPLGESRSLGGGVGAGRNGVIGLDGLVADLDRRRGSRRRGRDHVVGYRVPGEERGGDVAGRRELRRADRVELEFAVAGRHGHGRTNIFLRRGKGRVSRPCQRLEQREVGQDRQSEARHDDGLAADAIRQPAEEDEEAGAEKQRNRDHDVDRLRVDLEHVLQEEQGVELTGIPHHGLAGGEAEQREQRDPGILPLAEGFGQRRLRALALFLHPLESRRFVEGQANPDRNAQKYEGKQERNAPSPVGEILFGQHVLDDQDDDKRQEQAERGRRLDPRRVIATLVVGRVFGDIGRSPTVFAAQRQALQHAQRDQDDRRGDADRGRPGKQADEESRQAHDENGDEECVFAPYQIADATEDERAERTHQKARGESQKREDVARGLRIFSKERRADEGRERTVEVEVIPFENRSERRSEDDLLLFSRHAAARAADTCCHCHRNILP